MLLSRRLTVLLTPVVFLVVAPAVMAFVPWALSHLGPRASSPNRVGLVLVGIGYAGLAWTMVSALRRVDELPDRLPADWSPKILLVRGPYAFSRNPIYVFELVMWIGWAVVHGSVVAGVGTLPAFGLMRLLVWREERDLLARFGDAYRSYAGAVPRWLGRPRTRRSAR
jgi:protein-S-isoprenylcysteine O-methyltransferase Ste14